MFEHVFLDMDGVLCDFISSAMRLHGHKYEESTYPRMEWQIDRVMSVTEDEFWRKIDADENFWPCLDAYPWWIDLLEIGLTIGHEMRILTTPNAHHNSYSGKRKWLLSRGVESEVVMCRSKHLLAAEGRLLIDDSDKNIDQFRLAGGMAVLLPQPWNTAYQSIGDRLGYVRRQINRQCVLEVPLTVGQHDTIQALEAV